MNIALWLHRSAHAHPQAPAIALGTQIWADYASFARQAAGTAAWLREQGVLPGGRVALFMANRPQYLPLLWGVWWAGATAVPINAKLHVREAAWILAHSGSQVVWCEPDQAADLGQALQEAGSACRVCTGWLAQAAPLAPLPAPCVRQEDDPAWLFYTSGTTGRPKGATLGQRQLRWMSLAYLASVQSVAPGDCMLHPAPLSHGGGLYHLPYVLQAALNVVPVSGGFEADECLDLAAHWQRASFFAAPTIVRRLVDAAQRRAQPVRGLATITYGGGPMYLADLQQALQVLGPHLAQIYGQGECPMSITVLPRATLQQAHARGDVAVLASVGVAQSMVEVEVRDTAGQPVPVGSMGEVCVRGEVVMQGYWQDTEASARSLRDGWLYTGDLGRLDAQGYLTLLDRSKDLIISGGSNIYPREVEEVLLTHPAVAEVAVIGRPDAEWGEVVVAYVVRSRYESTHASLDKAELEILLSEHCLQQIARFKRPKHYCWLDELPKNHYGKVLKTVLRRLDAERRASAAD